MFTCAAGLTTTVTQGRSTFTISGNCRFKSRSLLGTISKEQNLGGVIGPSSGDIYTTSTDDSSTAWFSRATSSGTNVWTKSLNWYTFDDQIGINSAETRFYIIRHEGIYGQVIMELDASDGARLQMVRV